MPSRVTQRLGDMRVAIRNIETLLDGKSLADVVSDAVIKAALERFLEIVSEASRHVPPELTDRAPEIPWVRIRALGNLLRHGYNKVDPEVLWKIYAEGELSALLIAVDTLTAIEIRSQPDS